MTDPQTAAAQRQRWYGYFRQAVSGSETEVEAAVDAAMEAIASRADQAGVIAAGQAAAAAVRANGGRRLSPPPAPVQYVAPAPPVPSVPPTANRPSGAGTGVVSGLQQRQEMFGRRYLQVWNFRLEQRDASGSPLPPIPVELRALSVSGQISNGDVLQIPVGPNPQMLKNLTTGAIIKTTGRPNAFGQRVALTIFTIIFLSIVGVIVAGFLGIVGN